MPGVSGSTAVTRLGPPTQDMISKISSVAANHPEMDPAMDSESRSLEDIRDVPELTNEEDPSAAEVSIDITDKVESPLPVTPETPKVQQLSSPSLGEEFEKEGETRSSTLNESTLAKASIKENLENSTLDDALPNRARAVSLDDTREARDGYQSPDLNPHTDDKRHRRHSHGSSHSKRGSKGKHYDDASSSDDDSYFAKHLPSPKSGRSFSYSSSGSAQAGTSGSFYQNSVNRESDASLSFSDESEDEMQHHGVHISPMISPKGTVADMHLYPQRITRMHSVSSLVSSASEDEGSMKQYPSSKMSSTSSMSSQTTTGTSSGPSTRNELHDMAVASADARLAGGRRSPFMGQHVGAGYFIESNPLVHSPPPLLQGYMPPQGVLHPQPQPMTPDQMAAWSTSGNAALPYQGGQALQGYGSTMQPPQQTLAGMAPYTGGFGTLSDQSNLAAYGDDSNQLAGGFPPFGGPTGLNSWSGSNDPSQQKKKVRPGNGGGFEGGNGKSRSGAQVSDAYGGGKGGDVSSMDEQKGFRVYWQRWIMLFYMSLLNLLSDWTCYSVAPIALLTVEAFGEIDPEKLVVVFLGANAVATACEPIILARLGLRRTVLFGSLLLMIGSIVKSGGVPPILKSDLQMGHDEWRLYFGFFLVGLSQPLYQCTPALLSASWFPEEERTMATGVALNANQLGIGFAFIFGTVLVGEKEDIIPYFGLLSTISTIAFLGTLIQFDDAPPTPPSSSARVMRGSLEVVLPSIDTIVQSVRGLGNSERLNFKNLAASSSPATGDPVDKEATSSKQRRETKSKKSSRSSGRKGGARRRATGPKTQTTNPDSGLLAPSSARSGPTAEAVAEIEEIKSEALSFGVEAPSPVMPGRVAQPDEDGGSNQEEAALNQDVSPGDTPTTPQGQPGPYGVPPGMAGHPMPPPGMLPMGSLPPYQYPYWDPRMQQQMQQQQAYYQQHYYYYQQPPQPHYYPMQYRSHLQGYDMEHVSLPAAGPVDEGAEPIVTITPHHLDIDIRDDQVIRSTRACLSRPGFIHALVSFTVSGIVINTLSTYMDYLVSLNGAPRYYTGVVGGTFQFVIMISSLIIGKQTDKTRAYYSVTVGMLVLGAFGLAECGVSLDSNRGGDLRWSLIVVAALVGPLQPVSTELGVDVAYPLSENTVLVIQQLFSNLLSALFIPIFKALKDVGSSATDDDTDMLERPEYTFSFYLLIVLHTAATVFFATFNGQYLRYEHELQKKAEEERKQFEKSPQKALHPFMDEEGGYESYDSERQSLLDLSL